MAIVTKLSMVVVDDGVSPPRRFQMLDESKKRSFIPWEYDVLLSEEDPKVVGAWKCLSRIFYGWKCWLLSLNFIRGKNKSRLEMKYYIVEFGVRRQDITCEKVKPILLTLSVEAHDKDDMIWGYTLIHRILVLLLGRAELLSSLGLFSEKAFYGVLELTYGTEPYPVIVDYEHPNRKDVFVSKIRNDISVLYHNEGYWWKGV